MPTARLESRPFDEASSGFRPFPFQPIAGRNGIIEIAGPERAPFNEIVACYLKAVGDPRAVVRDSEAGYWGGGVEELSLVPLGEAPRPHRFGRMTPPLARQKPDPGSPSRRIAFSSSSRSDFHQRCVKARGIAPIERQMGVGDRQPAHQPNGMQIALIQCVIRTQRR